MHTLDFGQQEKVKCSHEVSDELLLCGHYYVIEVTAFSPAQPSLILKHHHSYNICAHADVSMHTDLIGLVAEVEAKLGT